MHDTRLHAASSCGRNSLLLSLLLTSGRAGQFFNKRLHGLAWRCASTWDTCISSLLSGVNRGILGCLLGLLLAGVVSALAWLTSYSFAREVAERIEAVIRCTGTLPEDAKQERFSHAELAGLPPPVERYFRYAVDEGVRRPRLALLRQEGQFRLRVAPGLKAAEGWSKLRAEQYVSVAEPAYVWSAKIHLAPFLWIKGWDSYVRGAGHMLWKLFSALTVVDFGGPEISKAGLVRWLSEAVYYPTALLPSSRLRWEPVDDACARCVLAHAGMKVTAVFFFNAEGQVERMETLDRCRTLDDGSPSEDKWVAYFRRWQARPELGLRVPGEVEAVWRLLGGPVSYALLRLTDLRAWDDLGARRAG